MRVVGCEEGWGKGKGRVPFGAEEHVALVEGVDVHFDDCEGKVACEVLWLLSAGFCEHDSGRADRMVLLEHCGKVSEGVRRLLRWGEAYNSSRSANVNRILISAS